jgi:hypothetical protein
MPGSHTVNGVDLSQHNLSESQLQTVRDFTEGKPVGDGDLNKIPDNVFTQLEAAKHGGDLQLASDKTLDRASLLQSFDPVEGAKHLQSHAQRPNSDFQEFKSLTTQADRQTASQRIAAEILNDPKTAARANGQGGTDFYSQNGRAMRFSADGKLQGFLDTGTNRAAGTSAPRVGGGFTGAVGRALPIVGPLLMVRDFRQRYDQLTQPPPGELRA